MCKDGAGDLSSCTPSVRFRRLYDRKPPHQRKRGDSNCKESLSAHSYYIKHSYQRGRFLFLFIFLICSVFTEQTLLLIVWRITQLENGDCPQGLGYGNSETLRERYLHLAPVARQQ